MDINRSKLLIVSLFLITICFWFLPFSAHTDSRGISVISDLSHQSGKLGSYRALLIGINDYNDPKIPDLETAVNDANAMADLLRDRYGFQIELLLDRKATREAIYKALRKLASSTKPDDSILIYYAGHGDLDRLTNDGWWIPADAKGGDPITYLDNFLIQKYIGSMQARHVLLVSDSCYSGTLFGQARAMPPVIGDKYYLNLYNEKSRWGMTSGNKTPVSDRGTGNHSVFAYQLLKELTKNEKPYISTQEIYTRIAPIVSNNSEQTPLCRPIRNTGDQGGEFVFVASSVAVIEKPATKPASRNQNSKSTSLSPPDDPSTPTVQQDVTWDFETGDLRGWTGSSEAFSNQPTFGDNPTARRRDQPAFQQGDYWIGTFENRPSPVQPAGRVQGDRPQGTLSSSPFRIGQPFITFLIGGGCDINVVRAELLVNQQVVRRATGKCSESMSAHEWDVTEFQNQIAQIRLIDNSSGGWGHINFDHVVFRETPTDPSTPDTFSSEITWNFETGDLLGWQATGSAFRYQPTFEDNPTARRRGQPARQQGRFWIGSFEKRPSANFKAGSIQGDGPQGTLTSQPFVLTKPTISFLIGGGCNQDQVGAALLIEGRVMVQATGRCNESMQRVSWRVTQWVGKTAQIQLYDRTSGPWGHINFDDVQFGN